jgi:uncharacterized protein with HEPN domain
MSDATPNREWRFYLDDMTGFCKRVETFTHGLDQNDFVSDAMRFDAKVRNLETAIWVSITTRYGVL